MKTQMNNTSLSTYRDNVLPASARMESIVLKAIEELGGRATNLEISTHLGWPINRVTGRVNNLATKRGLLAGVDVKYVNNRPHTVWGIQSLDNSKEEIF